MGDEAPDFERRINALNWTSYCSNSPVRYRDPTGMRQAKGANEPNPVNPEQDNTDETEQDNTDETAEEDDDESTTMQDVVPPVFPSAGGYIIPTGDMYVWLGAEPELAEELATTQRTSETVGTAIAAVVVAGGVGAGMAAESMAASSAAAGASSDQIYKAVRNLIDRGMSENGAVNYINEMSARFGRNVPTVERVKTLQSHMLRSKDGMQRVMQEVPDILELLER